MPDLEDPSPPLTQRSSSGSSDAGNKEEEDPNSYDPPLEKWKKKGKPYPQCLWSGDGRPAAWRVRERDPERPQVYGIAARKGHREPWKTGLAMDEGCLEHPGIKDWGDIPDYDKIAKEKAVAAAKEKTGKDKEMKKKERDKAGKAEAAKKEEEKYVKLPWYMAAMGVKVVKLPPKPE